MTGNLRVQDDSRRSSVVAIFIFYDCLSPQSAYNHYVPTSNILSQQLINLPSLSSVDVTCVKG